MSSVEIRIPAVFNRRRPVITPSGRTKKLDQQLCLAEVLLELIHTWLLAEAACIAAGMVIPGRVHARFNRWNRAPTWVRIAR